MNLTVETLIGFARSLEALAKAHVKVTSFIYGNYVCSVKFNGSRDGAFYTITAIELENGSSTN